jgi:glycosyltransferase involved in cell wall biosynthesis
MTFSIIVPFFNEGKYIKGCVNSLLAQDFPRADREFIFIDSDSTDNSASIVKQFSGISLLNEPNRNVYIARNRGLATAKGEIIAFTDADCVAAPDWLSQFYQAMKDPQALIALGAVYFNPESSVAARLFQDLQLAVSEYLFTNRIREKYYGYTNNMAVRASVFKQLGNFSTCPVAGDTEIVQRCAKHHGSSSVIYFDNAQVRHMEVKTALTCLKKLFFYGKYNTISGRKTTTMQEFFKICFSCCKKNRYPLWKAAYLFLLLFLGNAASFVGVVLAKTGVKKAG